MSNTARDIFNRITGTLIIMDDHLNDVTTTVGVLNNRLGSMPGEVKIHVNLSDIETATDTLVRVFTLVLYNADFGSYAYKYVNFDT